MKIACPSCRQKLDVSELAPFARINCPRCGGGVIAPKPFGALLLEEPLGERGGVSAYRALDLTLDREVLVKILEHGIEAYGEGFQALGRRAAAVNHTSVVPIYSCGAEQGLPYLATQFMPGGALAQHLGDGPATLESIRGGVEWVRGIAAGLQAAVAQGVVHGTVTPLSILLDAEGRAKLTDFGLEVLLASPPGRGPGYGDDVAPYLSPEVLGNGVPTPASDVFGLGAVLYRLLCGVGPCGSLARAAAVSRFWQQGQPPPSPASLNPAVPQELSEVCMRMLDPDPSCRPTDFAELARLLTSRGQIRPPPGLEPADKRTRTVRPLAPRASLPSPSQPSPGLLPARRERWMNALISGCIVVALVLGMVLYVRTQGYPAWVIAEGAPAAGPPPANPKAPGLVATSVPAATDGGGNRAVSPSEQGARSADTPAPHGASHPPAEPAAAGAAVTPDPLHAGGAIGLYAARRPRPAGLGFQEAELDLPRYLAELPADILPDERERIALIGDTRNHLVRLMKYMPYLESKESDIRLRSGPAIRGTVPYCNEGGVAIRVRGDNALRLVPWSDLAIDQVVAFFDYYIRVRLDQGQAAAGSKDSALRHEVAEDCLRSAVFCDWYERPRDARRLVRQALQVEPAVAARVERLLPTVDW